MTTGSARPPAPAPGRGASEAGPPRASSTRSRFPVRMLLLIGAVALVAMAATSVGGGSAPNGSAPDAAPSTSGTDDEGAVSSTDADGLPALHAERFAERAPDDPRALGDADAPVVMIEWGDFLCGYCAHFAREIEPELIRRYVDTGILRIEWRDLPLQGEAAWVAAVGGRAAADQDAFWDYHEQLYADTAADRQGRLTREGMRDLAGELDLDVAAFEAVFDDPDVVAQVGADRQEAQQLGISGTPAFLIDDQPVLGAQTLETFARLIETAATTRGVEVP
jgi:protein-disulfide isomerase